MTNPEYKADIAFLLARACQAGGMSFREERDVGLSSNSLVAIAYGSTEPQILPRDQSDLDACERAFARLPEHRKGAKATAALYRARVAITENTPRPRLAEGPSNSRRKDMAEEQQIEEQNAQDAGDAKPEGQAGEG
jgi:hypothetical protein